MQERQSSFNINKCFSFLSTNARDLYLPSDIAELYRIPDPLEFNRNWITPNIPFKIKGGIHDWPAIKKWSSVYFCNVLGDKEVSVAVTPNGYADAVTETIINDKPIKCFALPEERIIKLCDFMNILNGGQNFIDSSVKESQGVFYIQKQNSNLIKEFPELLPDIDENLLWASKAFDATPAAINLWIGDKRAVTSLHKDPFENIYCVISGYKDFILIPPTDRPWLPCKMFPVGQYKEVAPGHFEIFLHKSKKWMQTDVKNDCGDLGDCKPEGDKIPWIDIDPLNPEYVKYPAYRNAKPLKVRVEAGDVLYLPSLWYHHVSQSHGCIAVNYWYDMKFDIKYVYFQLLEDLMKSADIS